MGLVCSKLTASQPAATAGSSKAALIAICNDLERACVDATGGSGPAMQPGPEVWRDMWAALESSGQCLALSNALRGFAACKKGSRLLLGEHCVSLGDGEGKWRRQEYLQSLHAAVRYPCKRGCLRSSYAQAAVPQPSLICSLCDRIVTLRLLRCSNRLCGCGGRRAGGGRRLPRAALHRPGRLRGQRAGVASGGRAGLPRRGGDGGGRLHGHGWRHVRAGRRLQSPAQQDAR